MVDVNRASSVAAQFTAGAVGASGQVGFSATSIKVEIQQTEIIRQVPPATVPKPSLELACPPPKKGLQTNPKGWPKGSVRTAGGYTIVPEGKTNWRIYSPGQKPKDKPATRVHGDPHVTEKDGGRWDFTKSSDFVLPDGTRIFAKTSSEKGKSVTTGLDITNGHDHVNISGINKAKPKTGPVTQDAAEFRAKLNAQRPNRPVFKLGGDGDDWFLVKGGKVKGEITGASLKDGSYVQKVNGKPYRLDPSLRPKPATPQWVQTVQQEATNLPVIETIKTTTASFEFSSLNLFGGGAFGNLGGFGGVFGAAASASFSSASVSGSTTTQTPTGSTTTSFSASLSQFDASVSGFASSRLGAFGGTFDLGFGFYGGLGSMLDLSSVMASLRSVQATASRYGAIYG